METIYQLPTWAETVLVLCIAVMLAGLAAFIAMRTVTEAIEAESKLERNRSKKETKALNKWQKLYEEERQLRADDNAKLIAEIIELQGKVKRMERIMSKVKVADL